MKGGRTGTWWGGNDGLRGGTAQVEGIKTEDKGWERGDNKRENEPAEEKRNGNAPGGGKKWNKQYSTGGRTQAHTFTSIYCSNVTIWEVKPNQSKSRWGPGVQYICSIWIYDKFMNGCYGVFGHMYVLQWLDKVFAQFTYYYKTIYSKITQAGRKVLPMTREAEEAKMSLIKICMYKWVFILHWHCLRLIEARTELTADRWRETAVHKDTSRLACWTRAKWRIDCRISKDFLN